MKQRALVSIDLILDTRHGTLRRIDEKAANALVVNPAYRNRMTDDFHSLSGGVIDNAQYKELYSKRDVETLALSRMSDFVFYLRMDIKQGMKPVDRGVTDTVFTIDINIWPYDLLPPEIKRIRRAVAHYMPTPSVVNVVNLPPAQVTPAFLDDNYEMFAYYDHEDWLGPQTDALVKHPLPTTVLMTPMISSSGVIPEPTDEIKNPFLCRSAMLVKFVALHYIPVEYACFNPFILQHLRNSKSQASAHSEHTPQEPT